MNGTDYNRLEIKINQKGSRLFFINLLIKKGKRPFLFSGSKSCVTLTGMERVFAIGDIHGCLDKLVPLMNMIKINPAQDFLVFIGDYIDRGDHSREVVDYLVDLKLRLPELIFLLGNHEQMLLEYIDGRILTPFSITAGKKP